MVDMVRTGISFSVLIVIISILCRSNALTVSTYNLWNVMFHWEIRKYRIAQMIRSSEPDIIAFQEVRAYADGTRNQIDDLKRILPSYRWSQFYPINTVGKVEHSYKQGWEREGLGILSRVPMQLSRVQPLTFSNGPDKNKRMILHIRMGLAGQGILNIAVVHFSYDRQQQCSNAKELANYLHNNKFKAVIILGDFNTYSDFEMPIDYLTGYTMDTKQCFPGESVPRDAQLKDAWTSVNRGKKGLTFSNMPTPGYESRPDRILVSPNIKVLSAYTHGSGDYYKGHFASSIISERYSSVFQSSKDAFFGYTGYSCLHDCGPRASCRCGVCVLIGNKDSCNIPDCSECNSYVFIKIIAYFLLNGVFIIQIVYGALQVLFLMNRTRVDNLYTAMGCTCCLCSPEILIKGMNYTRRSKRYILCQLWPFCKLSPAIQIISGIFMIILLYILSFFVFSNVNRLVYQVPDESFFPSDHLMLTADLFVLGTDHDE